MAKVDVPDVPCYGCGTPLPFQGSVSVGVDAQGASFAVLLASDPARPFRPIPQPDGSGGYTIKWAGFCTKCSTAKGIPAHPDTKL